MLRSAMRLALTGALMLAPLSPVMTFPALAQGPPASNDDGRLRQQAADYARLYAATDAAGLSAMWTEDGIFTDSNGRTYKGRAAIADYFRRGFKNGPATSLNVVVDTLTFPADGVAVEEGTTTVASGPEIGSRGRYMVVHTKKSGQWLMQTAIETACPPAPPVNNLPDLDWLVGSWTCKGTGDKALHMRVDWSKNKSFLICRYSSGAAAEATFSVARAGSVMQIAAPPAIEELEIIGWDPAAGHLRSWHFDAEGGFGNGKILHIKSSDSDSNGVPASDEWREIAHGTEADGTADGATYIYTFVDRNTFKWQSTRRSVAGRSLPDAQVLTVTRDSQ